MNVPGPINYFTNGRLYSAHWAKWLGHMIVISEQSLNSSISLNKASRLVFKERLIASHSCLPL